MSDYHIRRARRALNALIDDRNEAVNALRDALLDALSGLEYVRLRYGALDGVGWDRIDEYRKRWLGEPSPVAGEREEGGSDG